MDKILFNLIFIVSLFTSVLCCGESNLKSIESNPTSLTKSYPLIFQAWSPIENKPDEDELVLLARHDLVFTGLWSMRINWKITSDQMYKGLSTVLVNQQGEESLEEANQRREKLKKLNPNLKLLCEIRYREDRYVKDKTVELSKQGAYPPDSEFWLRDENGTLCPGWGEDADGDGEVELDEIQFMLLDFRNPALHELIAEKALALKESGLFDGIMLDWWNEYSPTTGKWPDWKGTHLNLNEEKAARIAILQKISEKVGDDFLILVNSNSNTVPLSAPLVNGLFMECSKPRYDKGYTIEQIKMMETTLLWAEENLRQPRINCLEAWRIVTDYTGEREVRVAERNSEENLKWMRMITTLSLTHSDGYVLFADDNAQPSSDHLHNWYDLWDADLGSPVGKKGAIYINIEGLFIREFENGWVVYNRSGVTQSVSFEKNVKSFSKKEIVKTHKIPNFDGDIFLK
ncbi:MAG: hypothetical protein JXA96_11450 [Sedimentisphaerales bacterium]|nr:hypothetical protein [Sedimentisphaerales bacterium]